MSTEQVTTREAVEQAIAAAVYVAEWEGTMDRELSCEIAQTALDAALAAGCLLPVSTP